MPDFLVSLSLIFSLHRREFSLQEAVNDVDAAVARFAANARGKPMEGSDAAVAAGGGDGDDGGGGGDGDDDLRRAGAELLRCHKLFVKAVSKA